MALNSPLAPFTSATNVFLDTLGLFPGGPNAASGNAFYITELDGSKKREIVLTGRAMPIEKVKWEGEQHTKQTWYQGNPVATIQILGARERNTTVSGTWKNRFIAAGATDGAVMVDTEKVSGVEEIVRLFHEIRRAGRYLEVAWLSESRRGVLKEFSAEWKNDGWVEWSMGFEWAVFDAHVFPNPVIEPIASANALSLLNALLDAVGSIPAFLDLANAFTAGILTLVEDVGKVLSQLLDVLQLVEAFVRLPGTIVGAIRNLAESLANQCMDLISRIAGPRSSAHTDSAGSGDVAERISTGAIQSSVTYAGPADGGSSVTNASSFRVWTGGIADAALALAAYGINASDAAVERYSPEAQAEYVVRQGDTLYSIAELFYGSSDAANYLATVNRLSNARIPPGTKLLLPPPPTGVVDPTSGAARGC